MRSESLDLAEFIRAQGLEAEIAAPGVPTPTVDSAAAAMGVAPEQVFKSADIVRLTGATVQDVIQDSQGL